MTIRTRIRTWLLQQRASVNIINKIDYYLLKISLFIFFKLLACMLIIMTSYQLPLYLCSWFELWFYEIKPLERREILAEKYELAQIFFSNGTRGDV